MKQLQLIVDLPKTQYRVKRRAILRPAARRLSRWLAAEASRTATGWQLLAADLAGCLLHLATNPQGVIL